MSRAVISALVGSLLLAGCASNQPPPAPVVVVPPPIDSFGDWHPPTDRVHYLACPQNYCLKPDLATVLIPMPAATFRDVVRQRLDAMPKVQLLAASNEGLRLVYRQSDPAEGGTASVTVEIVDADDGVSGIAIYTEAAGRASYPRQERDRAWRWLNAITAAVPIKPKPAAG